MTQELLIMMEVTGRTKWRRRVYIHLYRYSSTINSEVFKQKNSKWAKLATQLLSSNHLR